MPTIVKTVHELLTTYDVTDQHLCINERGNHLDNILKQVRSRLAKDYPGLLDSADYFDVFPSLTDEVFPVDRGWVCVFYVKGGSEGYYVHVEVQKDRKESKLLFLGKTLLEGEAGISWAEKMVCALSRILEV